MRVAYSGLATSPCPRMPYHNLNTMTGLPENRPERLITVADLAETLKVSTKTVYRLVESRKLPHYRLAGGLRFRMADVNDYVDACRVEPVS
jgi:excisionase family DNA binding protein